MARDPEKSQKEEIQGKLDPVFARVGGLSRVQRMLICLLTFALVGAGYYYFILDPKQSELGAAKAELKTQVDTLASYKIKVKELKKYEGEMAKVQEEFDIAMKALPEKKELPSLLTGVSRAGSEAGLEVLLFQPDPVANKEFYMEIPLSMKVQGRYHQIADFFFQVAGLSRIVNIKDISMDADKNEPGLIQMSCSAVTYMFSEPPEGKSDPQPQGKNKG